LPPTSVPPTPIPEHVPTITEFPVPTTSNLLGSAPGPDGNVWFTEVNANNVDRATAAAPKTAYVLSMDAGFAPKTVSLKKQGFTLKWMFLGPNTHSATDSSGMGLFDSGTHSFVRGQCAASGRGAASRLGPTPWPHQSFLYADCALLTPPCNPGAVIPEAG